MSSLNTQIQKLLRPFKSIFRTEKKSNRNRRTLCLKRAPEHLPPPTLYLPTFLIESLLQNTSINFNIKHDIRVFTSQVDNITQGFSKTVLNPIEQFCTPDKCHVFRNLIVQTHIWHLPVSSPLIQRNSYKSRSMDCISLPF